TRVAHAAGPSRAVCPSPARPRGPARRGPPPRTRAVPTAAPAAPVVGGAPTVPFTGLGLGRAAATYGDIAFQRLVHRALMYAAGHRPPAPVGVGLIGYGAIARDHAASIAEVAGLQLAGVCDISPARRDLAAREWSVPVHAAAADMFDDPDVGMVVVGTPPVAHAESVLAALAAGKHVVCEKPFALRVDEVDRMTD